MGGYLSHGAIVAREYGLTAIQDGQLVEVDGDAGEVLVRAD
jgi:hypothetical protein